MTAGWPVSPRDRPPSMTVYPVPQEYTSPPGMDMSQYQYFPYRPRLQQEQQIFMHKSAMQLHAREMHRTEMKPHQCQQCLKSFSSNHQLVQHIRVHTGEKPYKCSYCDRRFKQLSHVQQHTRLHTGERPYKCHYAECGRAFIQLSNLQQHLRNHDTQIERMKNRPFHCQICGKGFATESSLRTHTTKHAALIGGPNAVNCPVCHKMYLGGAALMEHMKHVHKDPNASGVAAKRRTPNHPCPVCGKQYVNEGSLRKHMATHPEAAGLASPLRMWPCSVCQAVFTHESAFLTHMDHMRMDPKHQFAAQYVLSRAAAEQRERETLFAAAAAAASSQMGMNTHMFPGMSHMGGMGGMAPMSAMSGMGGMGGMGAMGGMGSPLMASTSAASPSARSDSSRMSTPAESKMEPRTAGSATYSTSVLPPSSMRGELEQRAAAASAEAMGSHVSTNGGAFYSDRHKMEPANISRLDMLNRLDVGNHAILQAGMTSANGGHQSRLTAHAPQASRAPGDNMRAMIQQTQAELVRSTLTSQAESARSLGALRGVTSEAETMMGTGGTPGSVPSSQTDARMFQTDLVMRTSQPHDMPAHPQQAAPQPHAGTGEPMVDPFRIPDSLRLNHNDPRAGYSFLPQNSHHN